MDPFASSRADLEPEEWFNKLNALFTTPTAAPWQDHLPRPSTRGAWAGEQYGSSANISRYWTPRNQYLDALWSYNVGDPPLPQIEPEYHEVFCGVIRKARSNYAPLCIGPMLDRVELQAVATQKDSDANGDDMAADIMDETGFVAVLKDIFKYQFTMADSYAMVVPGTKGGAELTNGTPVPTVHAIDPRRCIGVPDLNNPLRLAAALVHQHDPILGERAAHLFLPGEKWTVRYDRNKGLWTPHGDPEKVVGLDALGGIPIVRFENPDGIGEYEPHIDLLDRIIDTTLQRIIGFWYQALRQRGLEGDEDEEVYEDRPDAKEPIDFDKLFKAGPGAMWRIPEGFKVWESQQSDFSGILKGKLDDAKEFAAVTGTPLHFITPDAANGSAQGAGLMRESLTSKCRDRRIRSAPRVKLLWRMLFALAGEPDRGRRVQLQWGPIEFHTLAEQGSASAQSLGTLSLEDRCVRIWDMTPEEAKRNIARLRADGLLGLPTAPTTQQTPPETPTTPEEPPNPGADDDVPE
ncbi:hypothetical protein BCA37_10730 [Mycobacterium sp. djl-10]|nr:hypothetical protein BCA37_10730 [Mycobacterium sp. djl-10]